LKVQTFNAYDVYGADIANNTVSWEALGIADRCTIAPAHQMPYKDNEFDMVVCSDVMEHIPLEQVPEVIRHIKSLSPNVLMVVSLAPGSRKMPDGSLAHKTVLTSSQWLDLFKPPGPLDILPATSPKRQELVCLIHA